MTSARRLAPLSLILATVLFAVTLPFAHIFAWGLLHAFAEAAMIGGLADWFAVVALFRHPMGIPIPHTAILPKHREKLTSAIVDVLENNWLNKESILERIRGWAIVPEVLRYLGDSARRQPVLRIIRTIALNILRDVDTPAAAGRLSALLQHELTDERILRAMQRAGTYAVSSGLAGQMLPPVFERGSRWCSTQEARELVVALVREASRKYAESPVKQLGVSLLEAVRIIDYDKIAGAVLTSIARELDAARTDADNPIRQSIERALADYAAGLENDEEIRAAVQRFRESLSSNGDAPEWFTELVREGLGALRHDLEKEDPRVVQYIDRLVDIGLERLQAHPESIGSADLWVKDKIGEAVESYHGEIGKLVRDNLSKLDDEEMVRMLEAKVGDDLQFIRLNGAIVGGTVGALLYLGKWLLM